MSRILALYLGSFLLVAGIIATIGLRRIVAATLALPFVVGAAALLAAGIWLALIMAPA